MGVFCAKGGPHRKGTFGNVSPLDEVHFTLFGGDYPPGFRGLHPSKRCKVFFNAHPQYFLARVVEASLAFPA